MGYIELTPTECTIHLGTPVVPDEYMIYSGWLNGTCSNVRSGTFPSTNPVDRNSPSLQLQQIHKKTSIVTPVLTSHSKKTEKGF